MTNPIVFIQNLSEFIGDIFGGFLGEYIAGFVEIILILSLVTFVLSILKRSLHTHSFDRTLGKKGIVGTIFGSLLGALTPVCSCSVSAVYGGLLLNNASVQAAAAFLFAAPAVNEFALAAIFQAKGFWATLIYVCFGLGAAMLTGLLANKLGLKPTESIKSLSLHHEHYHKKDLLRVALLDTYKTLKTLLIPISLGILFSTVLGQFQPELEQYKIFLQNQFWGPIVATFIGLPLHVEAASAASFILPLIKTGIPLGTSISLLMAVTVSSVSEVAILRKIVGDRAVVNLVVWYFIYCSALGIFLNYVNF